MSVKTEKKWNIKTLTPEQCAQSAALQKATGFSRVLCDILVSRGYTDLPAVDRFIKKEDTAFFDPFLMADMERAVARIEQALAQNEPITVYGDYDVDGVTSVSVLVLYLRSRGASVDYYIPNRNGEGYGINRAALDTLSADGTRLIVTVDTGVTANDEIAYAHSLGMDVVVTDHHECPDILPDAEAVVNCRRQDCSYPFKELAGVGVVFKLVCAMEMLRHGGDVTCTDSVCRDFLDLVALGTVADVMPLVGENRLIVSVGLSLIEHHPRLGFSVLLDCTASQSATRARKRRVNSSLVGFTIAPRLNAAGRLESASVAAELFLSESSERVREIAAYLCDVNARRQDEENIIASEATEELRAIGAENDPVIVLASDHWHSGIIGIVSSRITDKFNRPSILISFDGDIGKGSGRSVKGLDLVCALSACSDLLIRYGGHELAAGLTIKRSELDVFRRRINEYARSVLPTDGLTRTLNLDCELQAKELTLATADELTVLEPFGSGNPTPLFFIRDARVSVISGVGQNRHTKLRLEKDGVTFNAMFFGHSPEQLPVYIGDRCDLAAQLDANEYQGVRSVQIIVRDIRLTSDVQAHVDREDTLYRTVMAQEHAIPGFSCPDRNFCARVFSYIRGRIRAGVTCIGFCELEREVGIRDGAYAQVLVALRVLEELHILSFEKLDGGCRFSIPESGKVSLDHSRIYRQLSGETAR